MKHTKSFLIISCIALLAACSNNGKKVLVVGHTNFTIKEKNIVVKEEKGHDEKTVEFGSGQIDLTIESTTGEHKTSLNEKGVYLLNAKHNDTIIGSYQNYATNSNSGEVKVITQEELKRKIDSLEQLVQGKNIGTANRTFFIKPFEAARISENPDAILVAPYHKLSAIENQGEKLPEVYRFFTINEIREIIAKLKEATMPATPEKSKGKK